MVILADKNGGYDGLAHSLFEKVKTDLPIVLVNWIEGYVFNERLLGIKDYVLACFCEYGWNVEIKESHIWGINTSLFLDRFRGEEWVKFDDWVKNNPPKMLFKRELLKKDVTKTVLPVEYPSVSNRYPIQSAEEFNNRPINVFQYWGRSNECRLRIQGEIWLEGFKKGFQVCDNVYYVQEYLKQEPGEKWVTLWIPHWARIDMTNIMAINNLSKLSLSWPGAGFKCFRTMESPSSSVLVMHKNKFAWAYDWDETNCILVDPEKEMEGIEQALSNKNLYEVYANGMKTVEKYRIDTYATNYIQPIFDKL